LLLGFSQRKKTQKSTVIPKVYASDSALAQGCLFQATASSGASGCLFKTATVKNRQIAALLNLVITGLISRNDYSIKEDTEIQVVV
tara:strand:+ start:5477 stop:5734 length:258 start_codon:yes stop_codon:yes gene_type:complete